MITTILLFVLILLIVVLVHEFGHFYVAKKSGMRVDEFGFGFPPKLFGVKKGETTYSLNLLPLGGFVKIYGEDGEHRDDKRSFGAQPIWQRSLTIAAGVLMNFLLAYVLFSAGHALGTPTVISGDAHSGDVRNVAVQIIGVGEDSPAKEAGIKPGDKIKELEFGEENIVVEDIEDVQNFIEQHKGQEILFTIERGDQVESILVEARTEDPKGQGLTGIQLLKVGIAKYPPHIALVKGAETTYRTSYATFAAFGSMIKQVATTGTAPEDIAGPVGIAVMTGTVSDLGFVYVLQFIALISLNLGILNLVPFPALDGGRLAFLFVEKIKGSPVSKKVEGYAHMTGFALLILLVILITYKDIMRLL